MISEILNEILVCYPYARDHESFRGHHLGTIVRNVLPEALKQCSGFNEHHIIKGSVGQGGWATVPWIAILDKRITTTTQDGVYIVYLFVEDGSSVYLTLNQGCTKLIKTLGRQGAINSMLETAYEARNHLYFPDSFTVDNNITMGNRFYEQGCISYRCYRRDNIPSDKELLADLAAICATYMEYFEEMDGTVTEDNDMARIPWDKYEVALLIETYHQIKAGADRNSSFIKLSNVLRQLAINRGIEIDDTYRNLAGMTWQYGYIEKAFDKDSYVNHTPSKLFSSMADLSINEPQEFTKILEEAKELASKSSKTVNSAETAVATAEKSGEDRIGEFEVDFSQPYNNVYTYPISFVYLEKETQASNWAGLYTKVLGALYDDYPDVFDELNRQFIKNGKPIFIADDSHIQAFAKPRNFAANLYVEINRSAKDIIKNIKLLLDQCNVDYKNLTIRCSDKKMVSVSTSLVAKEKENSEHIERNVDEAFVRNTCEILVSDFPNGIRHGSVIDCNKLKRIYENRTGCVYPENMDVQELLKSIGVVSGDKVYILTDEQKTSLCEYIQGLFAQQYKILYYSELLSGNNELFSDCHIEEVQLLRTILGTLMPKYSYHETFMLDDQDASVASEIEHAYSDAKVLNYQQLKRRLPFIELDAIKWTLSASDLFVWTQSETFALVNKIRLDAKDVEYVHTEVLPRIHSEGYASLNSLSLQESCDLNPEISFMAVRDAMYVKHMASGCSRHGVIVTPKGKTRSSYEIVTAFCRSLSSATIDELKTYEEELTGYQNGLSLLCACNSMVRIDQNTFINDAHIAFDKDTVDHAISLFVQDRIVPITAINSFTSFPHVEGYEWNLYLVESFLRKYSKRFIIEGGPARSSYVGGICSRELHFNTYEDKLAVAVIQDGIPLNESDIGNYLVSKKYILRRTATIKTVLKKALSIREQRGDGLV